MAVSNQAYMTFTEPGFQGHFKILAWYGDKAHVLISDSDSDATMHVVWKSYPFAFKEVHAEGLFITFEKLYIYCRNPGGDGMEHGLSTT